MSDIFIFAMDLIRDGINVVFLLGLVAGIIIAPPAFIIAGIIDRRKEAEKARTRERINAAMAELKASGGLCPPQLRKTRS